MLLSPLSVFRLLRLGWGASLLLLAGASCPRSFCPVGLAGAGSFLPFQVVTSKRSVAVWSAAFQFEYWPFSVTFVSSSTKHWAQFMWFILWFAFLVDLVLELKGFSLSCGVHVLLCQLQRLEVVTCMNTWK